eukprot:5277805-Pyramimonas_sp.AAC.1
MSTKMAVARFAATGDVAANAHCSSVGTALELHSLSPPNLGTDEARGRPTPWIRQQNLTVKLRKPGRPDVSTSPAASLGRARTSRPPSA